MKERPILFSGPMVLAILEGRKTQTRRIVKPQPATQLYQGEIPNRPGHIWFESDDPKSRHCPYGQPGDWLWVRESLRLNDAGEWVYTADNAGVGVDLDDKSAMTAWAHHKQGATCPSIHMPRWASRLLLEITAVRVERLQDIGPVNCKAEGIQKDLMIGTSIQLINDFEKLWNSINGKRHPWDSNPFVWVIEFKRLEGAL